MKYIIFFIYWLITWIFKYLINLVELIWHLNIKKLSCYDDRFSTISSIIRNRTSLFVHFNKFERFIYWCNYLE